jgi:heptosyltransferase-3
MERFVLIRPGALGDTLLTLPTLALLRRERPTAHVTLVARRDVLPLARSAALASATHDWSSAAWAALFSESSAPVAPAALLRVADPRDAVVVAWLADADGAVARTLAAWGARRVVIAPARPPLDGDTPVVHTALLLARALAPLGIAVPATLDALAAVMPPLRAGAREAALATQAWEQLGLERQTVVALHPGSGSASKCWPPEGFAELARWIVARGWRPLLVEGPADGAAVAAVQAALGTQTEGAVAVARGLEVAALAALLRRCAGYVGNDSGVSHLAALIGVPSVVIFGPSDPARWAPLGAQVRVVRAPAGDLTRLSPSDVWDVLRSRCEQT